jgi:hypothetical protein
MLRMLKKLRRDERGNVLILMAAAMPLLVGSAGLAVDTIQWTLWKRQLQRAADSAAIAGVYQRIQVNDAAQVTSAVSRDLGFNQNTGIALYTGYPEIQLMADSGDMKRPVRVTLGIQKSLTFSSIFMASAPIIVASATAATVPGNGEYCFVSLETNPTLTGITIGGNSKIEMNCGMMSNSPASNSALSNGTSSSVKATVIAAVGGVSQSTRWNVDAYDPYTPAIEDPYANVSIDRSQMKCFNPGGSLPILGTSTSNNFNGSNASVTLADARARTGYSDTNCFRGLSVGSGNTLTLPAGTYYIGEGGMNIQGTLNCSGCTFVLTNIDSTQPVGQITVNSGAATNISSPTTGPYSGLAIYQDRAASDTGTNRVNGNSGSKIEGALYFPKQEVIYNGDGTSDFVCTRLVGRRLVFTGNGAVSNKFEKGSACPFLGNKGIEGGMKVRLIA